MSQRINIKGTGNCPTCNAPNRKLVILGKDDPTKMPECYYCKCKYSEAWTEVVWKEEGYLPPEVNE